jgi:hypothetical protein
MSIAVWSGHGFASVFACRRQAKANLADPPLRSGYLTRRAGRPPDLTR